MVYNAMKLFMEVNPQLFDECSHEYTESQNNADSRKKERQAKWERIASLAKTKHNGQPLPKTITHSSQGIQGPPVVTSPNALTDVDPLANHAATASRRLENLKLGDDIGAGSQGQGYERPGAASPVTNSVRG